jgi:hypothetical protein
MTPILLPDWTDLCASLSDHDVEYPLVGARPSSRTAIRA